ncbi:MAG TPA: hypothetical protein PLL98_03855 [Bacillota bacterium]|nr:hypothetical protein [Bacillota bacterium]HOR85603.1 hypothetical protein [Bacillota bacterium]HPL53675.1 hypothetical protein [Bacillota bacterium]
MRINETTVIPIIIAIVELIKGIGLPRKFSAVAAVIAGALIGIFFLEPQSFKLGIFKGIIYGLTASGLYSGTKNVFEQVRTRRFRNNK